MEKTYKFMVPQNKEVEKANVRIENGEILVDVEFKEIKKPEQGDVLVNGNTILLYSGWQNPHYYFGFAVLKDNELSLDLSASKLFISTNGWRFATEEERCRILERIKKEHNKCLDEETKKLIDIRWRTYYGGQYCWINDKLEISYSFDTRDVLAENRYKSGNYFRKEQAAQKILDKIKNTFKYSKAE